MTREEARSWIIDHWGNDLEDGTKQSEVVKICLSALSTVPCEDCISRQVVDDVIAEIKSWYWQADRQALAKDPCVVDAMVDLFIRTIYKHIGKAERGK